MRFLPRCQRSGSIPPFRARHDYPECSSASGKRKPSRNLRSVGCLMYFRPAGSNRCPASAFAVCIWFLPFCRSSSTGSIITDSFRLLKGKQMPPRPLSGPDGGRPALVGKIALPSFLSREGRSVCNPALPSQ